MRISTTPHIMPYSIVEWTPFFSSGFKTNNDVCAICRNNIDVPCIMCCQTTHDTVASGSFATPDKSVFPQHCPPATGSCTHTFHAHCVSRWNRRQHSCPLCNRPWNVTVGGGGDDELNMTPDSSHHTDGNQSMLSSDEEDLGHYEEEEDIVDVVDINIMDNVSGVSGEMRVVLPSSPNGDHSGSSDDDPPPPNGWDSAG
jgi:E3 ubiquitin-protein ligase RBX1